MHPLGASAGALRWVAPGSIPGVEQQDAPRPGVRVKAACWQVSKLAWPAPASLHSSLPCVPIKLHFQLLLWVGGTQSWEHIRGRAGCQPPQRGPWSRAGSLWCWGGPKSRLDTGGTRGGTWGSRGSYRADWVAKARYWRDPCCIYVHMHVFPTNWLSPDQPEGGTEKHPFRVLRFTGRHRLYVKLYFISSLGKQASKHVKQGPNALCTDPSNT